MVDLKFEEQYLDVLASTKLVSSIEFRFNSVKTEVSVGELASQRDGTLKQ